MLLSKSLFAWARTAGAALIAVFLTLCTAALFTSCVEVLPLTPEEKMKCRIEGDWLLDADGEEGLDALFVEFLLNSDAQPMIRFVGYDFENGLFDDISIPVAYKVEDRAGSYFLVMDIDLEALREMYGEDVIDGGEAGDIESLQLRIDGVTGKGLSLVDYDEETGETTRMVFKKGTVDKSKLDDTPFKEILAYQKEHAADLDDIYKGENEYREAPDVPVDADTKSGSPMRLASDGGRDYARWMSEIADDTPVSSLCLPSAHDAGTHYIYANNKDGNYINNIKASIFRCMGVSQTLGFKEQFRTGVRVFDMRVRIANSSGPEKTKGKLCLFHDMLPTHYAVEWALQDILAALDENPTEGAIIMISAEGSQLSPNKEERNASDFFSKEFWTGFGKLFADFLLGSSSYGAIYKTAIWKETMNVLKKEIADKGRLAAFAPNMAMADLRGKVMVLCDGVTSGTDYKGMESQLCLRTSKDGKPVLMTADGQKVARYVHQNDYEPNQDKNETSDDYAARKIKAFRTHLLYGRSVEFDDAWIANDCNGYFWDGPVPNYAEYSQRLYPSMISLLRVTRTRGIFQQDFVGTSRFGRTYYDVIIKSAKEDWHYDDNASIAENLIKIPIKRTIDALEDWFVGKGFNAVKMPKTVNALQNPPYFDVYGESLTRTIVDNNFKP